MVSLFWKIAFHIVLIVCIGNENWMPPKNGGYSSSWERLIVHTEPVSSIYIWSENSSSKSEAKMAEIEELLNIRRSSSFLLFLFCAEILYFDIDLKNNAIVLWADNLFSDTVR